MSIPTQNIQFGDDQNYYIYRDTGSSSTNSNDFSFTSDGFNSNVVRISDKDLKFHGEGGLFICETETHSPKAQLVEQVHLGQEKHLNLILNLHMVMIGQF